MSENSPSAVLFADASTLAWNPHPRIPGVFMKTLLTGSDHPDASVNVVRVPVAGEVTPHLHRAEIETVYVLAGQCTLLWDGGERALHPGCVAAISRGCVIPCATPAMSRLN